ncbi:hypothetical protein [Caulobacter sp. S45]|uniref:hypothetical protein n=1 Tax=Caulobacter sp. S45 TaxID=1641861 RepID=UPI001575C2D3|nr:hypothetical protein [Caulobacter sp. S45]
MNEMLERAARGACALTKQDPDEVLVPPEGRVDRGRFPEPRWRDYVDDTIAVLTALREPTRAMIEVGQIAAANGVVACWQAMVDEALR